MDNILKKLKVGRLHVLFRNNFNFVPAHAPVVASDVYKLKEFLVFNNDILVLTGAGISTESGIPDYRSKDVGLYARNNHKPITYQEFTANAIARRRYWARSYVGWPRFSSVLPNRTHQILAQLETSGIISGIVTQNVDHLHSKAGSRNVIELHGNLFKVVCISCNRYAVERHVFQETMKELNPAMNKTIQMLRPDGDVELSEVTSNKTIIRECIKIILALKIGRIDSICICILIATFPPLCFFESPLLHFVAIFNRHPVNERLQITFCIFAGRCQFVQTSKLPAVRRSSETRRRIFW